MKKPIVLNPVLQERLKKLSTEMEKLNESSQKINSEYQTIVGAVCLQAGGELSDYTFNAETMTLEPKKEEKKDKLKAVQKDK